MPVQMDYRVIGLHISTYRRQRNLTQEQLAELAGISQQFLGNLERGKGVPSVKTLMSLCDALGVDSNALLRHSATHDPNAPCTLRDDHNVFTNTLTDQLFPQNHSEDTYIALDDLPDFDIVIPDFDEHPDV